MWSDFGFGIGARMARFCLQSWSNDVSSDRKVVSERLELRRRIQICRYCNPFLSAPTPSQSRWEKKYKKAVKERKSIRLKFQRPKNTIFRGPRLSLGHFGQKVTESPVSQLQNGVSTSSLPPFFWSYWHLKFTQSPIIWALNGRIHNRINGPNSSEWSSKYRNLIWKILNSLQWIEYLCIGEQWLTLKCNKKWWKIAIRRNRHWLLQFYAQSHKMLLFNDFLIILKHYFENGASKKV